MPKKGERHSQQARQKISRGKIEHDRRVAEGSSNQPTQKLCSKCETWLSVAEFGTRKHRGKSGVVSIYPRSECRRCEVDRIRQYKLRKEEEGTWKEMRARHEANIDKEKRAQRERERRATKRREMGVSLRGPRNPQKGPNWREGLPVTPIREFLEREVENGRGISIIEAATGIDHRRISGILKGEWPAVTLDTVDRLLVGLGCPEELHFLYPAEEEEQIVGYAYLEAA